MFQFFLFTGHTTEQKCEKGGFHEKYDNTERLETKTKKQFLVCYKEVLHGFINAKQCFKFSFLLAMPRNKNYEEGGFHESIMKQKGY